MRAPLAFLLRSYFVSSVLCFSSMPQEPGLRAPLLLSAHSPVNMHTPATVTGVTSADLSTLTSNQCTLCFELRDVRVCHLDYRNAALLSSERSGAPTTYRKTCWDRQLCARQRLQRKHVSGLRMHAPRASPKPVASDASTRLGHSYEFSFTFCNKTL